MLNLIVWPLRVALFCALVFLSIQIDILVEPLTRTTLKGGSALNWTDPAAVTSERPRNRNTNDPNTTPEKRYLPLPDLEDEIETKLASLNIQIDVWNQQAKLAREPTPASIRSVAPQLGEAAGARGFKGAVAVAVPRIAASAKWERVLLSGPNHQGGNVCADGGSEGCNAPRWQRWENLIDRSSALSVRERLTAVNREINALVKYSSDREIYQENDYWATLEETVELGWGDCEDIAIVKMWALHAVGVELEKMRLIVLRDTRLNINHAVLSVEIEGISFILDNMTSTVERAEKLDHYRPLYALSASGTWIYGFQNKRTASLAQDSGPARQAL